MNTDKTNKPSAQNPNKPKGTFEPLQPVASDSPSLGKYHFEPYDTKPQNTIHLTNITENLISKKHHEYYHKANKFKTIFYLTRFAAAICAILIPFFISYSKIISTLFSMIIAFSTAVDVVFNPKDKWKLFSTATDLLMLENLKIRGEYKKYKKSVEILMETENAELSKLVDLNDLVTKVRHSQKGS